GPSMNPSAPDAAMPAFAVAPNPNHCTAISSKKVVNAVSRIPEASARRRSKRYVISVRSKGRGG
ncbi:MAG: hypothetical protein P8M70_01700, partial [Verrucomicrobiota bacterium]|nr:hypothetical protein [Verrucomicrobiota bacterium]